MRHFWSVGSWRDWDGAADIKCCFMKTKLSGSVFYFHRMKKKRKRSASSSSSSSASSKSSSSSSSSDRRSKKRKKKKKQRSETGSKHHHRISSRESRRNEEGKTKKNGTEDEEVEWYPAPSNTSATFLNQKGGPSVEEEVEERRSSQIYSLSSDEEGSDFSHRGRKTRDKEQNRTKRRSQSQSPERGGRVRRGWSMERGKEDDRKDSKRRTSLNEERKRRTSCSSAEAEQSWRSNVSQVEGRMRHDAFRRNSSDCSRYENRVRQEPQGAEEVGKNGRKGREKDSSRSEGEMRSDTGGNQKQSSLTSRGRPPKDLPSNLVDIFNQIAQFEKQKGIAPK